MDFDISLREDIEWVNKWIENADQNCRRVLVIGDSVTRQYRTCLNDCLRSEGYVADLLATSYNIFDPCFTKEIMDFLGTGEYPYTYILFHIGAHHGYSIRCLNDENNSKRYEDKLVEILDKLEGYCNRLFVVTGTLENEEEYQQIKDDGHNQEIIARNQLLIEAARIKGWEVIDLYSYMAESGFRYIDWVHYEDAAKSYIANILANAVIQKNKNYNISNYVADLKDLFEKISNKERVFVYGNNRKAKILCQYMNRKGILCKNNDIADLKDVQDTDENKLDCIVVNTVLNFDTYILLDKSQVPYVTPGKKIYEYVETYLAVE